MLREWADISGETMNVVYDLLRTMTLEELRMAESLSWTKFAPDDPQGDLFRHQVAFTIERKEGGEW